MKRLSIASCVFLMALTACSVEDPVYWYEAGSSSGASGDNIPYYPEKPAPDPVVDDGYVPDGYSLVWSDEFSSNIPARAESISLRASRRHS